MRKPLSNSLAIGLFLIAVTVLNMPFLSQEALADPPSCTPFNDSGCFFGENWENGTINGWSTTDATQFTNVAPGLNSTNRTAQMHYPSGAWADVGVNHTIPTDGEVFWAEFWIKWSSGFSFAPGPSTAPTWKTFYMFMTQGQANCTGTFLLVARTDAASPYATAEPFWSIYPNTCTGGTGVEEVRSSFRVTGGVEYHVIVEVKLATGTNGYIKTWFNGTLTHNQSGIQTMTAGSHWAWVRIGGSTPQTGPSEFVWRDQIRLTTTNIAPTGSGDTTAPTTPTSPSASAISSSQVNLSWTASTDNVGVTGYRVERCSGSTCTAFTQIGTSTGTSYSDTGLSAGTSYRYRVRASDAAGNLSGYSGTASATTLGAPPPPSSTDTIPPPTPGTPSITLSSTNSTGANFSIAWQASIDQPSNTAVPSYSYTAGFNDGSAPNKQGTVTTNSLALTMLYYTSGTAQTAFFCVKAIDAAGNQSIDQACNVFTVPAKAADTIPPPLPGTPSLSLSSTNTTGVTYSVSWTASIDQPSNTAVPSYTYSAGYNDGQALTQGTVFTNSATYSIPFHTSNTAQSGFFCVTAVDAAGNRSTAAACSAFTVPAPSAPSAPTNLGLR